MGRCSLLQGIFQTQGLNPGLSHCRQILYQLSHKGSLRILQWVAYPFSRGFFSTQESNQVSCIADRFFTNWVMRETLSLLKTHSQFQWFSPTLEYSLGKTMLLLGSVTPSCPTLFNPRTVAHQAPLFMGFSRQEYWSSLPFPTSSDLPNPGIEPTSLRSPALAGRFFTTRTTWEALDTLINTWLNPIHVLFWTYICISNYD